MDSNKNLKNKSKWIIGTVSVCVLIYLGIQNIDVIAKAFTWFYSLISPLVLGLMLALILNVPMSFFESHLFSKSEKRILHKSRRPIAYILSILVIIGILACVFWLVIPELVDAFTIVINNIIIYVKKINESDFSDIPFSKYIASIEWGSIITNLESWFKTQSSAIMNTAVDTIGYVIDGVIDFFIAIIFSVYILFNKEKLKTQVKRLIKVWLPKKSGTWFIHACKVSSKVFRNFVSGQTIEAIILGGLCAIGMLILRIPYAPMIGALVGVTAIIPIVGAFVGAAIGGFMILTVSPFKALIFIIFILILQQLEGNLIYPKVIGSRINLPAMWVLAAVTIGGGIAGPLGMLLGVPAASVVYILVREATDNREKKQKK